MNMLVIGGLLIVGLLALVGAFLLSIGEKAPATSSPALPVPPAPPGQSALPVETAQATRPSATGPYQPALSQEEHLPALNGQFYEMVGELRTLHRQASELEQRLSVLTTLADTLEHSQSERVSIEEDE